MSYKKLFAALLFVALSLSCRNTFAQEEDTTFSDNPFKDDKEEFKFDTDDFNYDVGEFLGTPAINLVYGFSKMKIDKVDAGFAKTNAVGVKIGYLSENMKDAGKNISKYKFRYFSVYNISNDLTNDTKYSGDIRTRMWQFGFGSESGYGYKFNNFSITPYYGYGINWSRVDFLDPVKDLNEKAVYDADYIDYFDKSFRFGTHMESGLKIKLFRNLAVDASYRKEIVMPRVLFWKASGSALIECAGIWGIDEFVHRVFESTPVAAPIVNFVLKNALSYGIYELRKEKMSWPFDSSAPLTYNTFNVGVTFIL